MRKGKLRKQLRKRRDRNVEVSKLRKQEIRKKKKNGRGNDWNKTTNKKNVKKRNEGNKQEKKTIGKSEREKIKREKNRKIQENMNKVNKIEIKIKKEIRTERLNKKRRKEKQ